MSLRLTLRPGERAVIGGAVVKNGGSRSELFVENRVPVLREADILSPRAVRTPCERVVLALQLMYVDPDRIGEHGEAYRMLVADVRSAAPSCTALLDDVDDHVREGRYYQALRAARRLLEHERRILSRVR